MKNMNNDPIKKYFELESEIFDLTKNVFEKKIDLILGSSLLS
jgi:hypothetical protein